VKFYVPKSKELDDFTTRWNKRFKQDYPNAGPSRKKYGPCAKLYFRPPI